MIDQNTNSLVAAQLASALISASDIVGNPTFSKDGVVDGIPNIYHAQFAVSMYVGVLRELDRVEAAGLTTAWEIPGGQ